MTAETTPSGTATGAATVAATAAPTTAWYGKLPSLGDFASRRLPPEQLEALDQWLATGLAGWREREPEQWLQQFLAGPSWRFAWPAGTLPGTGALVGVLMPSVDRVGRYFPFTLLRTLPQPLGPQALSWLHRLDDLALDAMQEDWTIEQLEAELARLDAQAPQDGEDSESLPDAQRLCWWRAGDEGRPLWQLHEHLPRGLAFSALLSGRD